MLGCLENLVRKFRLQKLPFFRAAFPTIYPTFAHHFLTNKTILNMKKTVLGILAGAALTLSMASCGEKLLTQEQFDAEVMKGVEAGRAAVESEMNAKCDAEFETRVQERVNQLDQEAAAQQVQ